MAASVGERRLCALLHHIAQLTGENKAFLALHHADLHQHDVPACRSVDHTCRDSDGVLLHLLLGIDLRLAQKVA